MIAFGGLALEERPLETDRLDDGVVEHVARTGFALVPGMLSAHHRELLLAEAHAVDERFLSLPHRVNGVHQRGEQLTVRMSDDRHPTVQALVRSVRAAFARCSEASGVRGFAPSEARYMRYVGGGAGLGAHRDGKCYALVVCVFSVAGTAPFTVYPDPTVRGARFLVEPGDLVLLRATGLRGLSDGRPRHAVGAPIDGARVSLTLRMPGARPGRAPAAAR